MEGHYFCSLCNVLLGFPKNYDFDSLDHNIPQIIYHYDDDLNVVPVNSHKCKKKLKV